jgi:hypothetical protein
MITEDLPVPPKGFMTLEEEEKLTRLRQDRQDAAREERELLLAARTRETPDYRLPKVLRAGRGAGSLNLLLSLRSKPI